MLKISLQSLRTSWSQIIQNDHFQGFYPFERWVIGDEPGGLRYHRCCGLDSARRLELVFCPQAGAQIRDWERQLGPLQPRVGGKQGIESIDRIDFRFSVRVHKELQHRHGCSNRVRPWLLQPLKYRMYQLYIFRILLHFEDEDAAVKPDLLVTSEKSRERMRIHHQLNMSKVYNKRAKELRDQENMQQKDIDLSDLPEVRDWASLDFHGAGMC